MHTFHGRHAVLRLKNGYAALAPIEVRPADPKMTGASKLLMDLRNKVGAHVYEQLTGNYSTLLNIHPIGQMGCQNPAVPVAKWCQYCAQTSNGFGQVDCQFTVL